MRIPVSRMTATVFAAFLLVGIGSAPQAQADQKSEELKTYLLGTWEFQRRLGGKTRTVHWTFLDSPSGLPGRSQYFALKSKLPGYDPQDQMWRIQQPNKHVSTYFLIAGGPRASTLDRAQIRIVGKDEFDWGGRNMKRISQANTDTRHDDAKRAQHADTLKKFKQYLPGHWTQGKQKWHFTTHKAGRDGDYQLFVTYPNDPESTYAGYWRPYIKPSNGRAAVKYKVKHPTRVNQSHYGVFSVKESDQALHQFMAHGSGGRMLFKK
ncbi:MAG: hypothetical protein ACPGZP_02485 [Panacagrimonas sp.]